MFWNWINGDVAQHYECTNTMLVDYKIYNC